MAADGNVAVQTDDADLSAVHEIDLPDVDPGVRLPAEFERDLHWYLDDPLIAGLVADDGAFGSQLERAESFGFGALPCRKCGGTWRSRRRASDGEERLSEWRQGSGWKPARRNFARQTYAQALASYRTRMKREHRIEILGDGGTEEQRADLVATAYRERGAALMTEADFRDAFSTLPEELCEICDGCKGLGVVPRRGHKRFEVTARPTGSSVGKAGRHPDTMAAVSFERLFRYQLVERVMVEIGARAPLHRVAIACYYGPRQQGWEQHFRAASRLHTGNEGRGPAGGFEALWPITQAGDRFLDRTGPRRRSLDEEQQAIRSYLESEAVALDVRVGLRSDLARETFALYGQACGTALAAAQAVGWEPTEA